MYYAYMQVRENEIVDRYLSSNNLVGLPVSRETAVRVSDSVRKDFNTLESSFVALKMAERPFLREDTGFLLSNKEGLCGEGTRVIVSLLHRQGFDATRITLFDRELQPAHTLVSVVIDKQEFFVDSINSEQAVNKLLRNYDMSSRDFGVARYTDNIVKRREFVKADNSGSKPEGFRAFFDHYWLYSYEAIPYSKLLTKIGLDVRVFNVGRPNHWISILAEKPNMLMFFVTLIASAFITFLLHKSKIIRNMSRARASGPRFSLSNLE